MATPTQATPPPDNVVPPPDLPAVQMWQPKKPQRKLTAWQLAALIIGVPIIAIFTSIGAYTVAQWAFHDPPSVVKLAGSTPKPTQSVKAHKTIPPAPQYDLPGYNAVVSGTDEQTFVTALNRFRSDVKRFQFHTAQTDALTLSGAASAYLADLRGTNPPPSYQAAKLANITAAIYGRRAAATIQSAISGSNLASLQTGLAQANRAKAALAEAAASMPRGS